MTSSFSDASGYHVLVARASRGWEWEELATIAPARLADDLWVGEQCLTPDGRFVAVSLLPRTDVNSSSLRDRGALAYSIDVKTGRVLPLMSGVALAYFDPGCGLDDLAVLSSYQGDESTTTLALVDLNAARLTNVVHLAGEYTSAVPLTNGRMAATIGSTLDEIASNGAVQALMSFRSQQPYELHPNDLGGVDLLSTDRHGTSWAWRSSAVGSELLGSGAATQLGLFGVADGRNLVVGLNSGTKARAAGLLAAASQVGGVISASTGGTVMQQRGTTPARLAQRGPDAQLGGPGTLIATNSGDAVGSWTWQPTHLRPTHVAQEVPVPLTSLHSGASFGTATVPSAKTDRAEATCAVTPNDLHLQVPQPNGTRVAWAIQEAVSGKLKGTRMTRPPSAFGSGDAEVGLTTTYQPQLDFPLPKITGGEGTTVPPQLLEGIFAQESLWSQASWHAAAGMAGDPLIANYYGTSTSGGPVNYDQADCGYGLGQITSFMSAASTAEPVGVKYRVAEDYAENTAAAVAILVGDWNQLRTMNMGLNGGNPTDLENWYYAVWAYNTGIHTDDGAGHYGLGWTNNPIDPIYPPDRHEFGSEASDAAHPDEWPYQELVLGWIDYPLTDHGADLYLSQQNHSGSYITLPPEWLFCNSTDNCNPTPPSGSNPCTYTSPGTYQYHCWWHESASFATCPNQCHVGFTVSTATAEPKNPNPAPPACALDASVPKGVYIVDDELNDGTDYNVVGCPGLPAWESAVLDARGAMTVDGVDSESLPVAAPNAAVDWHQLGAGFGGHSWFTHAADTSEAPENRITVDWTPSSSLQTGGDSGGTEYQILVFVPSSGATDPGVTYTIYRGDGPTDTVTINQDEYDNEWVSLGFYNLHPGAKVEATDWANDPNYSIPGTDIGFGPVAFAPEPLTYHGGVALAPTSRLFAIGWFPAAQPVVSTYSANLNQFMGDLEQTPLYRNVLPQYYWQAGGKQHIVAGQPYFVGQMWLDTSRYPASTSCGSKCLDDQAIQNEVTKAIAANPGWANQTGNIYLVFTASGYAVCNAGGPFGLGSDCSGTGGHGSAMCAYHQYTNYLGSTHVVYGAVPYPSTSGCLLGQTGAFGEPNTDAAAELASHEVAEAMTDPFLGAWCGDSGFRGVPNKCWGEAEIGDKCFEDLSDQPVGSRTYVLQELFSDVSNRCASGQ